MITHQELASCVPCVPVKEDTGKLSQFEKALLTDLPTHRGKPRFAQIIGVLTVLSFSLLYAPLAQTAEIPLEAGSVLSVLNQDRIKYGLGTLTQSPILTDAARAKAEDILSNGYFAHTSPSGVQPWDFMKDAGFAYSFAGENLAINYTSAYELENDFMGSPAHRENLLSPLFTEIGIAVVSGTYRGQPATITVQMFASPADIAQ